MLHRRRLAAHTDLTSPATRTAALRVKTTDKR